MSQRRTPRLAWLLAATLTACGAPATPASTDPEPGSLPRTIAATSPGFAQTCATAAAEHERAVKDLVYLEPDFRVLQWPKPLSGERDGMMPERALLEALRKGELRHVLVQARGGIGKTELGKAIVAETCGSVPTFRVDLPTLYAGDVAPGGQVLLADVMKQVGATSPQQQAKLRAALAKDRWLVVVDAIEEVPTKHRAAVLQAMAELRNTNPQLQMVVMARPSVFEPRYGLVDLDAVLELPPLDCGRARSSLARLAEDSVDRARLNAFVETWHLDRQSLLGQQCYFPYLATYRDIQVVQRLAKTYDPTKGEMGGLQANLTQVHEAIVAERLQKELAHLNWSPDQVLAAVDALLAQDGYANGEWNLAFTLPRCLASRPGDEAEARQVCEKLLQSVLFERIGGSGKEDGTAKAEWKFGHQALADLFVARWIEAELKKSPTSCAAVEQQTPMLLGKEVAGYLVGRAEGARCLRNVVTALCQVGGFQKTTVAMLYKGLPLGPTRAGFVKSAVGAESASKGAAPPGQAAGPKAIKKANVEKPVAKLGTSDELGLPAPARPTGAPDDCVGRTLGSL